MPRSLALPPLPLRAWPWPGLLPEYVDRILGSGLRSSRSVRSLVALIESGTPRLKSSAKAGPCHERRWGVRGIVRGDGGEKRGGKRGGGKKERGIRMDGIGGGPRARKGSAHRRDGLGMGLGGWGREAYACRGRGGADGTVGSRRRSAIARLTSYCTAASARAAATSRRRSICFCDITQTRFSPSSSAKQRALRDARRWSRRTLARRGAFSRGGLRAALFCSK